MSEIEVQVRECCTCKTGVVPCAAWVDWGKVYENHFEESPDLGGEDNCVGYRGEKYQARIDQYWKDNPPPSCCEENACPECEGSTWIFKWVTLADLFHYAANKIQVSHELAESVTAEEDITELEVAKIVMLAPRYRALRKPSNGDSAASSA